jgi:hypothetical protein
MIIIFLLLLVLLSIFDLQIALCVNNGILKAIIESNFSQFVIEFNKIITILRYVDIGILIGFFLISLVFIAKKGYYVYLFPIIFLSVVPMVLDLNYHISYKILGGSDSRLNGIKPRVYMYNYYKLQGDNEGIKIVLTEGLNYLNSDDLFILVKNRKSHDNNFFALKNN